MFVEWSRHAETRNGHKWELRLEIAGSLYRSQVCRSQDEVLDKSEAWKGAMIEKGWH
jgi:hypothetical protein